MVYITQEEVTKEIGRWLVASIEPEFIKEFKKDYTGYTNKMPELFLCHMSKEYYTAKIKYKLSAEGKFEQQWDQETPLCMWITRLELLQCKCAEAEVTINNGGMVLKITTNAMKFPLFMQLDHKKYNKLNNHMIATVKEYWVKKYKADLSSMLGLGWHP